MCEMADKISYRLALLLKKSVSLWKHLVFISPSKIKDGSILLKEVTKQGRLNPEVAKHQNKVSVVALYTDLQRK